jgi:histidyl-tRNA synthetase
MATTKRTEVLLGGLGSGPKQGELVLVGCAQATVTVEPLALRKLKADKDDNQPCPITFGDAATSESNKIPAPVARIALVLKMLELMKGANKVRASLVKVLQNLLNDNAVPGLILQGSGSGFGSLVPKLDEAFSLTDVEKSILLETKTITNAYAVICTEASRQLLSLSTGVASLSSEACSADMRFLDQAALESYGNNLVSSTGMELRGVLDGSSVLSSSKGKRHEAFSEIPFVHAIASQILGELSKAVNLNISNPQSSFTLGKDSLPVQASGVQSLLLPFVESILKVVSLSIGRTGELLGAIKALSENSQVVGELATFVSKYYEGTKETHSNAYKQASTFAASMLNSNNQGGSGVGNDFAGVSAAAVTDGLHQALLLEAFAAVSLLRIKQGVKVEVVEEPKAEEGNPAADKKKKKKKEKKKKGGIGKGSEIVQNYFEGACMRGQASPYLNDLCSADASPLDGAAFEHFFRNLSRSIDWALVDLNKFLVSLRQVIEANQPRRKPKIAKGARDFTPEQMKIREGVFSKVVSVFKKHGAVSIDTPVFELRETLMGKYGEDSKLIYDLADQGGEILSLRYDLTVPFSRYCAFHNCGNIKRYHVGKVYRRDQPQMNRGRFREFFQCDFDIAGTYSSMVPDSEVIKVMVDILNDLEIGDFCIKMNHRLLLDSIMAVCGVPEQKFRPICSAIDKLDKSPWEEVRREMVEDKGLSPEAADKIGQIVELKGSPKEMLEVLKTDQNQILQDLRMHPKAKTALEELTTLFDFLEAMNALDRLSLDMSLARGLDYYTGVIYEAVLIGGTVGSIAAGGRYDYLVGSFAGKDIPAVGVSIGIERVYSIIEAKLKEEAEKTGVPIRSTDTAVLVSSIGNGMQKKRMEIANLLWSSGISAEFGFKPNPKMGDQITYALESGIPFMVLFGEDEINDNKVKIKDMKERTEDTVNLTDLVPSLKKLLGK